MNLGHRFAKYCYAVVKHTPRLARLAMHSEVDVRELSRVYLGNEELLPAEPLYNNLPASHLTPRRLMLNFLPLPGSMEKRLYGESLMDAHHRGRLELIRNELPTAKKILDLGGADAHNQCGALLAMGYPHAPETVHIVDLPVELRVHDPSSVKGVDHTRCGETDVQYSFRSMTSLERFPDRGFDMIWMGQTVEHIRRKDLEKILVLADDLLVNGGRLCLDTPNRAATKLLNPLGYIHPDHRHEYLPGELADIIVAHGYELERALAINPLPLSLKTGLLHRLEFLSSPALGDDADQGFSFYLQLRRVGLPST